MSFFLSSSRQIYFMHSSLPHGYFILDAVLMFTLHPRYASQYFMD